MKLNISRFRRTFAHAAMTRIPFLTVALIILGLTLPSRAEVTADVASPKTYEKGGVTFNHAGNWKVTEDGKRTLTRYLILETPGEAVVVFQIMPERGAMTIEDFAKEFSKTSSAAIPLVKFGTSNFGTTKPDGRYQTLKETFSITLGGVTLPHTRHYSRLVDDGKVSFIVTQAADEDLKLVEPGFKQVTDSFQFKKSR